MSTTSRRILQNTGYRLFADIGAKVASFALYVVMARELGSSGFGVFAFAMAFATLVTIFSDFGQDRVLTREVARDHSRIDAYFANTLLLKIVLSIPALIVGVTLLSIYATPETRDVTALLGIAVVIEQLMATCFATFQSFERLAFIPIALIAQRVLMAVFGIVALLGGAGVVLVAAIYLVTACAGFVIALWLMLTRIVRPAPEVAPRRWKALMIAAFPIGAAFVFALILNRADLVMLAAFVPENDVGQYAAAYRLFETTMFLSWSVGAAIYPVSSRLTRTSSPTVGTVFERSLKLCTALTLPLAVGAMLLAHPFTEALYGNEYGDAADALILLAPSIALYPFAQMAGTVLVSQNRQRVLAPVFAAVAAQNIVFNLFLIPVLGIRGAAFGTSLSQFLVDVPLMYYAVREVGRPDWARMLGGSMVASMLAGVVMWQLSSNLGGAIAAGAVVYLVSLIGFERLVYPQDARAIWGIVPGRRAEQRSA